MEKLAKTFRSLFMQHPVAPYLIVLAEVELVTFAYHSIFEPERLLFELLVNGVFTVLIAVPIIRMVLGQHRELQRFSTELERLSTTDQMTGVLNRQSFIERLNPLLDSTGARASAGAFAYLDADSFKQINDVHGHAVGDRALVLIADIIRSSIRSGDYCARLGGEEFGIFLKGASLVQAAIVAERIRARVHDESIREGLPPLSVSIGVASHKPPMQLEELMHEADRSLYLAKEQGRDSVVVELKRYAA